MGNQLNCQNGDQNQSTCGANLCGGRFGIGNEDDEEFYYKGEGEKTKMEDAADIKKNIQSQLKQKQQGIDEENVGGLEAEKFESFQIPEINKENIEKHRPDEISVNGVEMKGDLQKKLIIPKAIQRLEKKMENLQIPFIKGFKEAYVDTPWYLKELDIVYVGSWVEKKPYGIGKILYLEKLSENQQKVHSSLKAMNNLLFKNPKKQNDEQKLDEHFKNFPERKVSAIYEGQVVNGKANGTGRLLMEEQRYEGQFKDDLPHGNGTYLNEQLAFNGEFLNGKQHGFGSEVWKNGKSFKGKYVQGKKEGKGIMIFKTEKKFGVDENGVQKEILLQEKYDGEFKDGKFQGTGTYYWIDGRIYTGEFLEEKMHGYGEFQWPNGFRYEGNYVNDLREGFGKFYWKKIDQKELEKKKEKSQENATAPELQDEEDEVDIYIEGTWKQGQMEGTGTYFYGDLKCQGNLEMEDGHFKFVINEELTAQIQNQDSPDPKENQILDLIDK